MTVAQLIEKLQALGEPGAEVRVEGPQTRADQRGPRDVCAITTTNKPDPETGISWLRPKAVELRYDHRDLRLWS